ncbi:MAG: recombination protein RecR [Chloroflexi bacterium]|nr:recombination protein RecR [Chloroflexota bacterium]
MNESPHGSSTITRLVESFHRLPGIGPKSAQRLAYHVLRAPEEEARALAEALLDVKQRAVLCGACQQISDTDPCAVCDDTRRDRTVICVVEEPLDLVAIERTNGYHGLYHVLHGAISPADGVGPEDLKISELLARLRRDDGDDAEAVGEVIVATNPNLEGEATAMYLARLLEPLGLRVTRLARGLPAGADLEYVDNVTLERALAFRQSVE